MSRPLSHFQQTHSTKKHEMQKKIIFFCADTENFTIFAANYWYGDGGNGHHCYCDEYAKDNYSAILVEIV